MGTVSVNISLNSSSIEHQIEIGSTCINSVAKQANRKECSGRSVKVRVKRENFYLLDLGSRTIHERSDGAEC